MCSHQGLDVLEIMRNIHVFVSRYLYNLNNQVRLGPPIFYILRLAVVGAATNDYFHKQL